MNQRWAAVASRAIEALGVRNGDIVEIREHSGRYDVLLEMVLAIEQRDATPRVELLPPELMARRLSSIGPSILSNWDQHRSEWMEESDRVLVLAGAETELDIEQASREAWSSATERLVQIEERRKLPYLEIAVPTTARALKSRTTLELLENVLIPAIEVAPDELRSETARVNQVLEGSSTLVVQTGERKLHLDTRGRKWMYDSGGLPLRENPDEAQPVLNLPAGSVYTTVNEAATLGTLHLPQADVASDVVFHFLDGRISSIEASSGREALAAMFDRHTGEPRRISHIGIGLNTRLDAMVGWPLVDEHRHGALFIAFGENRYLGGENESSLNVDFVIPAGTLIADDRTIVEGGRLIV